jgi:hypothetical protein
LLLFYVTISVTFARNTRKVFVEEKYVFKGTTARVFFSNNSTVKLRIYIHNVK